MQRAVPSPPVEPVIATYCGLEEHAHAEACFDENGAAVCGYDEHVHDETCSVAPALYCGYDILLEKPISPEPKECIAIEETANKLGRKITVCHVLRYTAFYKKIKECLQAGVIGDIVSVQAIEGVAYWHQAHSFVRGNWRNQEVPSQP